MLMQRLPHLTNEEIMVIAGIPMEELRHTRAAQDWLAEGRQEGRQAEASRVTLRLLNRRCGPLTAATTAQIQARPSAGDIGSPGRRPARLPGPGRPGRLAGR
jgi:hypothetical protein